jgi:uncharacterized membrane protein YfcA
VSLIVDPFFWLAAGLATLIIAFGKGAFGGGLAIVGIPLMALVMDPIEAAVIVALLVVAMDMVALGTYGRATWSKPDLVWLVPGLVFGIGIGFVTFSWVDPHIVGLIVGLVTIAFAAHFFLSRGRQAKAQARPVSPPLALAAGSLSGFTTFVAHAGGPPTTLYLVSRGLPKTIFAGTSIALFTLGNLMKLPPYLVLGWQRPDTLVAALALLPLVPVGIVIGRRMHERLSREKLFAWCYVFLVIAAGKLIWDALAAMGAP